MKTIMNKEFTFLVEIIYWLLGKSSFVHDEYNLAGARYSSKTFHIGLCIAMILTVAIKLGYSVAFYCFRKLNKDINDLVKEIYKALIDVGFRDSIDFTIKYPNKQADFRFKGSKSFIRVMGIYSNSNDRIPLKGLSRSEIKGFKLAITWREEANEISNAEKVAIRFAIGKADKYIEISSCNPDNEYQDHIQYLQSILPFDLSIMQKNNEQIASIYRYNKFILNHYSNWMLNKHNLSQDIINNLEELKELDPVKAQSWYWGVPSILSGAIFARFMDKIGKDIDFQVQEITGGLDLGYATSAQAHPTVAVLCFIGENEKTRRIHQESEYYHSNATMQFKDTYEIANEIIDYYYKESIQFQAMRFGFTCYVDYGSGGLAVIDVLKKETQRRNINWLKFVPVDKSTIFLRDRIDWDTACMLKGILSINWKRCPYTRKELSLMQWLDKKKLDTANNEPQMLDLNDNCWDARMYSCMHKMKWLIEKINNTLLVSHNKNNRSEISW